MRYKKRRKKPIWFKILIITISMFLIAFTIGGILLFPLIQEGKEIADEKKYLLIHENFDLSTNETMKDGEGNLLSEVILNYKYAEFEEIPEILINSYITIEDKRFYSHKGVDYKALLRAALSIIKNDGEITQGGSTITQQLIKNVLLTQERSIKRKIPEFFLSYEIEKYYSKNDIIEFYLNTNYYGNGCYGIYSASKYYFDKEPKDLTIAECATIIGLSNSPSLFNPISNPEKALEKRKIILEEIYNKKIITKTEFNEANNSILVPQKSIN